MFKQTKSSKYISKSTSSWHKLSLFCNLFLGVENENPLNQPVNTCSSSASIMVFYSYGLRKKLARAMAKCTILLL